MTFFDVVWRTSSSEDPPFTSHLTDGGDRAADFASALIAALLANKPRDVFRIEENLSFAALRGLPRWLLEGDLGGVQ